jgi:hypothetical protein
VRLATVVCDLLISVNDFSVRFLQVQETRFCGGVRQFQKSDCFRGSAASCVAAIPLPALYSAARNTELSRHDSPNFFSKGTAVSLQLARVRHSWHHPTGHNRYKPIGVAPRTAQAAMRHSTINLTMNKYTDPRLLDVAGAVDALPALPLGDGKAENMAEGSVLIAEDTLAATGTDGVGGRMGARPSKLVPTTGQTSTLQSILDKVTSESERPRSADAVAASSCVVKRKDSLAIAVNESWKWAALDSNQRLPPCEDGALTN